MKDLRDFHTKCGDHNFNLLKDTELHMHGDGLSNVQSYIEAKGLGDPDTAKQMVQWIKALVT